MLKKKIFSIIFLLIFSLYIFSETKIDSLLFNLDSLNEKAKLKRFLQIEKYYTKKSDILAIDYYNKAIKIAIKIGDEESYFEAKKLISYYYFNSCQYSKVVSFLEQVVAYQKVKGKQNFNDYVKLAFSFYSLKKYDKVLEYYQEANKIITKNDNFRKGVLENLIGLTFYQLKYYEEAKKSFFRAIESQKKNKDKSSLSASYNNLSLVFAEEKEIEKAIFYTKKSLSLSKKENDENGVAISKQNLGLYHILQKKYSLAKQYLLDAQKTFLKLDNYENLITNYKYLSTIYFENKNFLLAKKFIKKSIELISNHNQKDILIEDYKLLSKIMVNTDNEVKADSVFLETVKMIKSYAKETLKSNVAETKAKIIFVDRNKDLELNQEIININNLKIKKRNELLIFISSLFFLLLIFAILSRRKLNIIKNLVNNLLIKNKEIKEIIEKNKKINAQKINLEKKNMALAISVTANHEINQPLMIIQGNLDMLMMNKMINDDEEIKKHLLPVEKSVKEMNDILNKMKQYKDGQD